MLAPRPTARLALVLLLALHLGGCGATPAPADAASNGPPGDAAPASTPAESPGSGASGPGPSSGEDAGGATPRAGTHRVALDRPVRVGARYERSVKVTDSRRELLVDGNKTLKDVDHRVQITLIADEEVLAVDARGRWQKIALTTKSFAAAGRSGDEPIVPPGTRLTVERGVGSDDAIVTSSTGALSKDAKRALSLAIPSNAKTVSDDEIFGSREPRAPGEAWRVARDVAARDLGSRGIVTSPDLVDGETRIVSTRDDRGVPCLEMAARMTVKIEGFTGLPAGTSVERGAVTAEMTGLVPVDVTAQPHRTSSRVGMELVAKIPVGKSTGTLTLESLNVRETVFRPR